MSWYPHVTVATVVEQDGHYLMVYENTDTGPKYNQPAGHLEINESLADAALRETLEETGWHVELTGVLSLNLYTAPSNNVTYLRVTFTANALQQMENAKLDDGIISAQWLSLDEIRERESQLRSPLVLADIYRQRAGHISPLELIANIPVQ